MGTILDVIQQSFGAGEITEALQSREDLAKQQVALNTSLNAIITPTASIKNRAGFEFISEVEDSTKRHRLFPFVFSREQAYAVVFGDGTIWFIKDGAIIKSGGTPVELVAPYDSEDLDTLYDAQSADVMYLTNAGVAPYKLTRTSDTAWTITKISFQDGPWLEFEDGNDEITLTPSAKTGSGVTVLATDAAAFDGTGIGDLLRIGYENPFDISQIEWGWATITATPTSTSRVVTIEKDLGYEYMLNPDFYNDIGFWEDRSTANSYLSYDSTNKRLVLNKVGASDAHATQEVTVPSYGRMTFEITVDTVSTQIRLRIGNTYAAADVLAEQIITTPGSYTYTTNMSQPTGNTVFVYVDTGGAPNDTTHSISRTSLMRQGLGTNHWRKSAWSATRGWPRTVTLHEQAVYYGGNHIDQPDTTWRTKIGEYESFRFNSPPLDTDGIGFTLASAQVNDIEWIIPHGELMVGTSGEEWRITPGPTSSVITPTSINARPKSKRGGANLKPIIAGNSLLFLGRNRNKVYAAAYSDDADAIKPVDLTVLAPHLFDGYTIDEWAYQPTPYSIVWCVRDDGAMLSLTYIEEQDIWAWCKHTTDGEFESVCVVPESGEDTVYVIVKRTIGGATKRYIEKLKKRIEDEELYDWYFIDSGVTINNPLTITNISKSNPGTVDITAHGLDNGDLVRIVNVVGMTEVNEQVYQVKNKTANDFDLGNRYTGADIDTTGFTAYVSGGEAREMTTTIDGLDHLEGETVVALADGSVETGLVVSGGEVTLSRPASLKHAGLPYITDIKTLPHDIIFSAASTSQGKEKKLMEVDIYFNKTRGAEVGSNEDDLAPISFNVSEQGDAPAPLFTGIKEKKVESGYKKLEYTLIRNSNPVPIEVVGIISKVDFSGK